jgi:hypothetical protein
MKPKSKSTYHPLHHPAPVRCHQSARFVARCNGHCPQTSEPVGGPCLRLRRGTKHRMEQATKPHKRHHKGVAKAAAARGRNVGDASSPITPNMTTRSQARKTLVLSQAESQSTSAPDVNEPQLQLTPSPNANVPWSGIVTRSRAGIDALLDMQRNQILSVHRRYRRMSDKRPRDHRSTFGW